MFHKIHFYNRRDDDDNTKYGNAIIKLSRFAFVLSLSQCLESADHKGSFVLLDFM